MLEMKNVSFSYGEKPILKNFSLKVESKECVCLSGASGCGKTTALRLILGLEKPTEGEISAPENISVVFQEDALIENMSLIKNVYLPLEKSDYEKADRLIKEFGLFEERNRKVSLLSGGTKRRVAILRALSFNSDALILDEAFTGIDQKNKRLIAEIIKKEYTDKGKPILMVSHIKSDIELMDARIVKM